MQEFQELLEVMIGKIIETLNCENPELDKHRYNCVGIQAVVSEGWEERGKSFILSLIRSFIHHILTECLLCVKFLLM